MLGTDDELDQTSREPVGVVGAGQLARMLIEAALPLGLDLHILAERLDDSASQISTRVTLGSPHSQDDLARFAAANVITTFDHELVDAATIEALEQAGRLVRPTASVVAMAQDKRAQRETLSSLGLPVPPFRVIQSPEEFQRFALEHGWPIVAKSVHGGYDGRGVWVLQSQGEVTRLLEDAGFASGRFLAEAWVPIERELAVLVARRPNGETAVYPIVETVQRDGICRELIAPARITDELAQQARRLGVTIAEAIGSIGMLAVELFESGGRLIVNELAARPHNSGHFTIEGCTTSQFEQHLRAVLDWPLGTTELLAPAVATVNVLGGAAAIDPRDRLPAALAVPGAHVHLYGKGPRPGRKLGHVTVLADDVPSALERAREAARRLVDADGETAL